MHGIGTWLFRWSAIAARSFSGLAVIASPVLGVFGVVGVLFVGPASIKAVSHRILPAKSHLVWSTSTKKPDSSFKPLADRRLSDFQLPSDDQLLSNCPDAKTLVA